MCRVNVVTLEQYIAKLESDFGHDLFQSPSDDNMYNCIYCSGLAIWRGSYFIGSASKVSCGDLRAQNTIFQRT